MVRLSKDRWRSKVDRNDIRGFHPSVAALQHGSTLAVPQEWSAHALVQNIDEAHWCGALD